MNIVKKLNKKAWILISVVALILLVLIFKLIFKSSKSDKENVDVYSEKFNITKTESFFIQDEDTKLYALYNSKGKKLTNYSYKKVNNEFYNHSTIVEDENDNKCVINDEGKTLIKCGKYKSLSRSKIVYVAKTDKETYIFNTNGKEIKKFKSDVDVDTYIDYDTFVLVNSEDKYYVIDYEGDIVYKFDESSDRDVASPTVNYSNGIVSCFYDGKTYIIDIKKNKLLTTISDEMHLCVNSTDEKGKVIVLNSCTTLFNYTERKRYAVIDNGKLTYDIEKSDECDSLSYYQKGLRCYKNNSVYFINSKGKKINDLDIKNMNYMDSENFAYNDKNEVTIYKNNKKVTTVEGSLKDTGYSKEGKYVIKVDKGYMVYNYDGKKISDESFKEIKSYYGNYYYVKIDSNKYSFITKDNKVSKEIYYEINNNVENYFKVHKEKDTYNVVDSYTGKTILPDSNSEYHISKKGNIIIANVKKDNTTYIYNLENGKEIIKTDGDVKYYDLYFVIEKDSKKEYYSYKTGKKFL